ncbi:MAG: MGH1-like glycoside hydrolase domain-containing protein [Jiangellaceae bacterium]
MTAPKTHRDDRSLDDELPVVLRILEGNWREDGGYTSPNVDTYPWQWLWDSCFHALVWGAFRDRRAVTELSSLFRSQRPSGFVPHLSYRLSPQDAVPLWGVPGSSTITQPPMYAHAARQLAARGFDLPGDLITRIEHALEQLWATRRADSGLLLCFHPWEVADDSPRWDSWDHQPFDRFGSWRARKAELVAALELDDEDAAVGSSRFVVGSVAFNALVAFNLGELAALTGASRWAARARALTDAIEQRWDPALLTWVDAAAGDPPSARVRTLDALLPLLVSQDVAHRDAGWAQILDPAAFATRFGPCGVHRAEPSFDPNGYWRGAAWPQLNYLLWVAARRQGRRELADGLATRTRAAAVGNGHAEYWNPDTGAGLGAAPQSWTTLWVVMGPGNP